MTDIKTSALVEDLRMKASIMSTGERIAWGSDTCLMYGAADRIEVLEKALRQISGMRVGEHDSGDHINAAAYIAEGVLK